MYANQWIISLTQLNGLIVLKQWKHDSPNKITRTLHPEISIQWNMLNRSYEHPIYRYVYDQFSIVKHNI